ncbi:hypothetical protein SAMN05216464_11867 [Mucilaginibacter pineti]|uniref:Uncharacterized protein n=1 Tax=Mucilaginibacter pineti TaxID=1391627 RepID=A0A1G7L7N5_9SPHI|nr:hypothetical protein [Mucilaginibacter pineti]SDF45455.1 hypothetical protein SAMN05216464_11867 [Mucilaginibacter pineti]
MKATIFLLATLITCFGFAQQNIQKTTGLTFNNFYYYVAFDAKKQKVLLDYLDHKIGKADSISSSKSVWTPYKGSNVTATNHNITIIYTASIPDTSIINKLRLLSKGINEVVTTH